MRRLKIRVLVLGSWGFFFVMALLMPAAAAPWISAMALPITAAGFSWGPQGSLALASLSSFVAIGLSACGFPVGWLSGPLAAFCLLSLLVWGKTRQLEAQFADLEDHQRQLRETLVVLHQEQQQQLQEIRSGETSIQGISELYGLSKQFLGTLDLEQALRITEEALAKGLPQMTADQQAAYLKKVQSLVAEGNVSMESLVSVLPPDSSDLVSWEKGGIVIGQLALGLRRVSFYRQVQELAIHDGLTGLLVRRHFRERLEEEVSRALRHGSSLVFLMVDLDHFKRVNDTYGHLVGDVVLREVSRMIQRSIREVDLVGRYGGEEFGVVLPEADRALGIQIAERIREAIQKTSIFAYDEKISCTVSIGVALCPEDAPTADQLIDLADRAMYQAKAEGRNRTHAIP